MKLVQQVQSLETELAEKKTVFEASDKNRLDMVETQRKLEKMEVYLS